MTLHLENKWVWDFWFAKDGFDFHIFYLQAPRALGNPDLRHWNTTIGHAISRDLINWTILKDALHPSEVEDDWDSLTTWTGSTFHHGNSWYLFYTGTSQAEKGHVQRIGLAQSDDLVNWKKHENNPIIDVDPRWYELLDKEIWYEQAWRDPWVFEYGGGFHAFITARAKEGEPKSRGVIAHAISNDLLNWDIKAPVTQPGEFAYLEVPQLVELKHRWYLIFCVEGNRYSDARVSRKGDEISSGTHYMVAADPFGPFIQPEIDLLYGDKEGSSYSGKVIQNNAGEWMFMTAIQYNPSGKYQGDISDPMPLIIEEDGQLGVLL